MINLIGGSGFIGSRFGDLASHSKVEFRILDKNVSRIYPDHTSVADVRNLDELKRSILPGVIINLAAEHRDDVTPRSLYDDVNVQGARNICDAAESNGVHTIVFTSSVAVYGFAPLGTDESGEFSPFNDYGRTKLEAEYVYKEWQKRDPSNRSLVIIRPTVVFGEANRGNVYNLLRQIASGKFVMIGSGRNVKSMAYVENIVSFILYSLRFGPGVHIYNYVDKPDFDMNSLVSNVYQVLGKSAAKIRIPYSVGYCIGKFFDVLAVVSGKKFPISAIRVKKFCSNTMFNTNAQRSGFVPPVDLSLALRRTIKYEFIDQQNEGPVFFSE